MAHIQRRGPGRWQARYRGPDGKERTRTFERKTDAERWLVEVKSSINKGSWVDPARSAMRLEKWAAEWLPSRSDLRASSYARLESIVRLHVVPAFDNRPLATISNSEIRKWSGQMQKDGVGAAGVRKSVFALRAMLDAAVADQRLAVNPAANVPLPAEHAAEQRYLDREQVLTLADIITPRYRALVLLGAFGGLRWGELAGLRRSRVDVLHSRITVCETATDIGGKITFGEPKTKTSKRTIPLARSIMAEVERHLAEYVEAGADALLFTTPAGNLVYRGMFWPHVWKPAVKKAGLDGLRIHDLRHTYVSLWIAAGANPKEVSKWAGHSTVAFTLDRYGHLYPEHGDDIADRLDQLLSQGRPSADIRALK
jgi:integrase